MSTPVEPIKNSPGPDAVGGERKQEGRALSAVAWTSFGFALLQSICTFLIGLSGARLLVSLLSLAAASSLFAHLDAFHRDGLRIPMIVFACVGAILNLILVLQIRRLRQRPSARWRLNQSVQGSKLKQERWQIVLSVATLVLVMCEELFHHGHTHHW